MSQTFHLQLATDTLRRDAQQLGVSPEQLQAIDIKVQATLSTPFEPYLSLTYTINLPDTAYETLAAQLNWSDWQPQKVSFSDYLWQQTCLECFISTDTARNYIEINANPDGRYAVYHFTEYREPASLPPPPLYLTDSQRASIDWATDTKKQLNADRESHQQQHSYERRFGMALNPLSLGLSGDNALSGNNKWQLHPCVILYVADVALYFAVAHASPPDFHQRRYWTTINPIAAN